MPVIIQRGPEVRGRFRVGVVCGGVQGIVSAYFAEAKTTRGGIARIGHALRVRDDAGWLQSVFFRLEISLFYKVDGIYC